MRPITILIAMLVALSLHNPVWAEGTTALDSTSRVTNDPVPFTVKIYHTWKQPKANALYDFSDESLGTLVGPDTIVTHNHFSPPLGRLPDEAFIFEDSIGRSIRWRAIDLKLMVIDAGTMLIRLPAAAFVTSATVANPATLRRLAAGAWLTATYWDNSATRTVQHDFQITQIDRATVKLADPGRLINPGDSGGGVYFNNELIGNIWSIDTDRQGDALGVVNVALLPLPVLSITDDYRH